MLPSPRLANCALTTLLLDTRRLDAPKMSAKKVLLGVCLLLNVGNVASFASMPPQPQVGSEECAKPRGTAL